LIPYGSTLRDISLSSRLGIPFPFKPQALFNVDCFLTPLQRLRNYKIHSIVLGNEENLSQLWFKELMRSRWMFRDARAVKLQLADMKEIIPSVLYYFSEVLSKCSSVRKLFLELRAYNVTFSGVKRLFKGLLSCKNIESFVYYKPIRAGIKDPMNTKDETKAFKKLKKLQLNIFVPLATTIKSLNSLAPQRIRVI